jgi:hypothetical protein
MYHTSRSMIIPWDPCTHFLSYLQTLGSILFSLGYVLCIGICVTALGFVIVHQAMIGMPRHHSFYMDHSEFPSLLSWTCYSDTCIIIPSLDHMWELIDVFEEVVIGGYVDYWMMWH